MSEDPTYAPWDMLLTLIMCWLEDHGRVSRMKACRERKMTACRAAAQEQK